LAFADPQQHEGAPHRLRTPLAEANVVFARATLVRMPFEPYPERRIARKTSRMSSNDVAVLGTYLRVVEIEIDDAHSQTSLLARRTPRRRAALAHTVGFHAWRRCAGFFRGRR